MVNKLSSALAKISAAAKIRAAAQLGR